MPNIAINDVLILGSGLDRPIIAAILAEAGLPGLSLNTRADLARHQLLAAPAAAALIEADCPSTERDQWADQLRSGGGLWSSTPLLALPAGVSAAALCAELEQRLGPLATPSFRDPESAEYRLVRLAGREQAGRLLGSLADSLRKALSQHEAGSVPPATAHRLAGIAGLYGYPELSTAWLAVETGESPDPWRAIALTREVVTRLESGIARDYLGSDLIP